MIELIKFKQDLISLKGKQTCFREYSLIALVTVTDVKMDEKGFSVKFVMPSGKDNEEEIEIGSRWDNVCIAQNGFGISYVGSQMLVTDDGLALYNEHSRRLKTDQDKRDLFRVVMDGKLQQIETIMNRANATK